MKATPRPLIKWKSFWLGILVLGFFGWAWAWSFGMITEASWQWSSTAKKGGFALVQLERRVNFSWDRLDPFKPDGFYYSTGPIGPVERMEEPFFSPPIVARTSEISVAYWFIGLIFLLVWSARLFWRWKREQKKRPSAFS